MRQRFWLLTASLGLAVGFVSSIPLAWVGKAIVPNIEGVDPVYMGTVWTGRVGNIPGIGPLHLKNRPLNVLSGKGLLTFTSSKVGLDISGAASLSRNINLNLKGSLTALAHIEDRFDGLAGDYDIVVDQMKLTDKCESGEGQARTDVLMRNRTQWKWQGPELSGPISCDKGDIVFNLSGQDARQSVEVDFRLSLSGEYRSTIDVITSNAGADLVLPLYGFEKTQTGYRLSEFDRWM